MMIRADERADRQTNGCGGKGAGMKRATQLTTRGRSDQAAHVQRAAGAGAAVRHALAVALVGEFELWVQSL